MTVGAEAEECLAANVAGATPAAVRGAALDTVEVVDVAEAPDARSKKPWWKDCVIWFGIGLIIGMILMAQAMSLFTEQYW